MEYLLRGVREGFRIGYNHRGHTCRPASKNMQSARQNPQVVEEYLAKEVKERQVIGPLNPVEYPARKMAINRRPVITRGAKCE